MVVYSYEELAVKHNLNMLREMPVVMAWALMEVRQFQDAEKIYYRLVKAAKISNDMEHQLDSAVSLVKCSLRQGKRKEAEQRLKKVSSSFPFFSSLFFLLLFLLLVTACSNRFETPSKKTCQIQ